MKVLILDDEQRMLDLLEITLSFYGYTIVTTTDPIVAEEEILKNKYDVMLLDLMMPSIDGITLCQQIRRYSSLPIVMLTARDLKEDIVRGFEAGADDYITKPFEEEVLVARIQAVTRRNKGTSITYINGLTIDKEHIYIGYNGIEINLTPIEYRMIHLFTSNPNKMFSREQLKQVVYRQHESVDNRTVDSHIRNVRDKLRKSGFPIDQYLITVYGYGYRWEQYE